MRYPLSAGCAALVLGLTLAGCAGGPPPGDVATVNGDPISRSDFDGRLEAGQQAKGIFSTMVQGVLIDQYAKDNHIDISDADVQKKEDDIKSKYPAGQFDQILKSQGLTEDDVKRILRQQLVVQKAVGGQVTVTDAQIRDYLAKNHATLDTKEQVRARHILVADAATAALVEQQLKAGAKFEDMAQKYSTDQGSKIKGGELGFFSKGQMVAPFENAAFSQPLGVVGPPVKSPFGYHIIEVEERKPAQVATYANSADKIKTLLQQQAEQTQVPAFLNGLRCKATINISDDKLKDALPPCAPPTTSAASGPVPGASPAASP